MRDTTFSGVISGTNGNIIKAGSGTLTLTGNNSYTGSTTISAGLLKIIRDDPTSYLAATSGFTGPGNLTIESSGDDFTADIVTGTHVQLAGTALGNLIIGKTGNTRQIDLSSDITTTGTQTYNGPVRLVGGDRTVSTTNSNVIFASTVNSDGTQRALTVTNGTGDTTFSGAIGGSAPVKSLTITSDQLTAGAITLNGALTATLGGSSSITGVIANGASTANLVKAGSGTLTLSASNTYTGTTQVSAGTLTVSGSGRLSDSTAVTVDSGAVYNVAVSDTVASIAGAGSITLGSNTLTSGGSDASTTFSGVISGTNGNIIKAGTGTLTLTGNNSYTGSTTISAGLLKIIRDDPTSYLAATSGFTGPGNLTIESSGDDFTADIVTGTHVQLAGTALGNLIIGKTGNTRQIDLSSDITTTGTQTYNGPVRLVGGDRTVSTTNSNVIFASTVNSDGTQRALTVTNGTGDTTFSGAIGGSAPVKSLTITSDQLTAGAITLNGALTATLGGSSSITGVIANGASTANLVKAGSGTLTLSGANTYTGTTTINAGDLTVSGSLHDSTAVTIASGADYNVNASDTVASIEGAGNIVIASSQTLTAGDGNDKTLSGVISGAGNYIKAGSGTQTLSASNTYTGTTQVSAGTLTVSGSGRLSDSTAVTVDSGAVYNVAVSDTVASIAGAGSITLGSNTLTSGGSDASTTFSGVISGTNGNIIKAGTGTLTLSGANTYTGTTTINAGDLTVSGSLHDSTAVTIASGADYNVNASDTVASIEGAGNIVIASSQTLTAGDGNDKTLSGVISGAGNYIKAGSGTQTLSASNTYTGTTQVSAGTLTVSGSGRLSDSTAVTVDSGAVYNVAVSDTVASIAGAGSITLGSNTLTSGGSDASTTFSGVISGTNGNIIKAGSGTLTLSASNTYTGTTQVSAGTLTVSGSGRLSDSTAVTVDSGAVYNVAVSDTVASIAGAGSITLGSNTLTSGGSDASTTFSGVISGTNGNIIKAGTGTLTLSGANTYTGTTTINAGDLTVSGSLHDSTAVTIASGADYNVNASDTVASIEGAGNIVIASSQTLTAGDGNDKTLSGVISGAGNYIKAGSGTQTLTGNNSYTGSTTISAGLLKIIRDDPTSYLAATSGFTGPGNLTIESSGDDFTADIVTGTHVQLAGTALGNLIIGKTGNTRQIDLSSDITTTGTQTYNGPVRLVGGDRTVSTTNSNVIFASTVNSDGTQRALTVTNGTGDTTFSGAIGGSAPVKSLTITSDQLTAGAITLNGALTATLGGSSSITGVIANGASTANLVKAGSGTLTLSASNTYTGTTQVSAGTLTVSGSGRLSDSTAVTVDSGAVYNVAVSDTVASIAGAGSITLGSNTLTSGGSDASTTFSGVISGTNGNIIKAGTGTLTLTGNNSYTGSTTISAGLLKIIRDDPTSYLAATSGFTGPGNLTIESSGDDFTADIVTGTHVQLAGTALGNLIIGKTGNTRQIDLSSDITTTGTQTYNGPVRLVGGDRTVSTTNSNVIFASTVNSDGTQRALTVTNGTGDTTFSGAIGGSAPVKSLTITSDQLTAGAITLNGALTATLGGSSSITGVIANGASTANLVKAGSGTLTLSGANTYTGTTTINAGDLTVSGSLHDSTAVTIASGADYNVNASDTVASIEGAGNIVIASSQTLTAGDGNDKTLSGVISGAGNYIKAGSGTQTLSASNTYTGTTQVSAGTLTVSGSGRLSDSTAVTVDSGAVYNVAVSDTVASIAGAGSITLGSNTLTSGGSDASTTFSGVISGTNGNIIKAGTGTLTLSGANTYTGTTTINAGDLTVSGSLHDSTAVTIASGADYNVNASDTVASIEGAGNIVIASSQTLTAGDGNDKTLSGVISGAGNYIKAGSGTQTLTGNNSYTGSTTISAGLLKIIRDDPTSYLAATSGFTGPGNLTIESSGDDFTADIVTGTHVQLAGTALGNLIIGKTGNTRQIDLSSDITTTGTQTYNGPVRLVGGDRTVSTTNSNVIFASTVNSDGTQRALTVTNGTGDTTFSGAIGGSAPVKSLTITSDQLTAGAITLNGALTATLGGSSSITGVIANGASTANLVKAGSGTLTLSASNTYTGTTQVSAGTLTVSGSGRLSDSTAVTVDSGAVYNVAVSDTVASIAGAGSITLGSNTLTSGGSDASTTFSGVISGTNGNIIKAGTGTLTLTGNNSYTGSTTISAGLLKIIRDDPTSYLAATSGFTGPGNLTIESSGDDFTADIVTGTHVQLAGTALGNLIIGKTGNTRQIDLSSDITTTGTQTYNGPVRLVGGDRTVSTTNSNVIFASTVNSDGTQRALTVTNGTGDTTFSGAIGGSAPVKSLTITSDQLTAGAITLNGALTATLGGSSSITGVIANGASTANLVKAGSGTLTLSGANTYTGTTTINAGDLTVSGSLHDSTAVTIASGADYNVNASDTVASIEGAGNIVIASSQTLTAGDGNDKTLSGVISGAGNYIKAGSGTQTLSASNTYTGTTQVSAGTLTVSGSGRLSDSTAVTVDSGAVYNVAVSDTVASIAGAGSITLGSNTLTSGGSDASTTFSGVISGTNGNIIKAGTGTLTLSASNTYTGTTQVSAGTLTVSGSGRLSDSTAVTVDSGAVYNVAVSDTVASIAGAGSITLGSNTLTSGGSDASTTFSGVISGTNGNIIKAGTGTLTLSGANTYTGTTTINAGDLTVSGSLHDSTAVTIASGADYNVNASDTVASIEGAGNIVIASSQTLTAGDGNDKTLSGVISGAGNYIKAGSGTQTLSASNTYTGTTQVSAGTLTVSGSGRLSDSTAVTVDSGAVYNVAVSDTVASIAGAGSITLGSNTLTSGGSDASTTFSGVISGTNGNIIKAGTGTLTLSGANTYTGTTTINAGDLTVSGSLHDSTAVTIASGADYNVNASDTVASIEGAGNIVIASSQTLTAGDGNDKTLSGVISGAGNYIKAGSGTQTLTGNNSYTGSTTISAGLLKIIRDDPTSYLAATSGFTGPGNLTIESSGDDFTADIVTGTHVQLAGTALGNLIIGKTGNTRQIDLSSDITTTGTQTYNGPVRLVGGDRTVSTTNSNVIFASTVNSDGTQRALTVTNGTGDTTFSGAIGGSAPVKSLTITSDQLTAGAITLNGALTATLGGSSSITGVIANGASTANLVKAGSGTLTLSASNTYTGTTQVSAGTLTVSGSGRLSDSTAVTVDSGAVYNVAVSDTVASIAGAGSITLGSNTLTSGGSDASTTFSGVISGTNGNIIKAGTGTLTLSGANTYTGTTTINAGDLTVSGSLHDSTAVTIASGADYNVNASDTVASIEGAGNIVIASSQTLTAGDGNDKTLSGVISGAGNYIKAGSGTQTLSASNTYTGTTQVSAGTLTVSGSGRLSDSTAVTVDSGAVYNVAVSDTVASIAGAGSITLGSNTLTSGGSDASTTFSGVISGTNGNIIKAGTGTLTLTGNNSYTGSTTISAGLLKIIRDDPTSYLAATSGFTGPGNLTIESSGDDFTADIVTGTHVQLAGTALGNLIIGKTGNSSTININSPIAVSDDISIYSGELTVNNNITSNNSGSDVLFNSSNITLNAPITSCWHKYSYN